MNIALKLTILFCLLGISFVNTPVLSQSNLSSGTIYKLSIPESGIYKISSPFINANLGGDLSSIDPAKIQIFCGGGGMLPRLNASSTVNDPLEIPLYVTGTADGEFNGADAIYFYAPGPEHYDFSGSKPELKANIYDQYNYLYIKFNDDFGKRIESRQSLSSSELELSTVQKIHRHELEKENLLGTNPSTHGSGQQWFGEAFANQWDQDFSQYFTSVNPIPNSVTQVEAVFAGRSENQTRVEYFINGEMFSNSLSGTNLGSVESRFANSKKLDESLDIGPGPTVSISYKPNESTDKGWLDYIQLITEENITLNNNELLFNSRTRDYTSAAWILDGIGQKQLWDVSDFTQLKNCLPQGIKYHFETGGQVKQFRIFDESANFPTPEFVEQIDNQNIKSLDNFDYLIVYHPDFEEAANLLKSHREQIDPLRVEVVSINQIYNEFASGRKDPTSIRDMARILQNKNESFEYMLLFGDASFDYRGIVPDLPKTNFVPTYQTAESLSPVEGFPYDDYFGMLSPSEGENFVGALELNIGRLPARTEQEALDMVNKIIHYETSVSQYNDWKMNICYSSDDEDFNRHINDSDDIAVMVNDSFGLFNQSKIYFDAFLQESTPGGERYPAAKAKINETINKGVLVYNYLGHGGPGGLAQERVLLSDDLRAWDNLDKLPIIITATCSFTSYEDPGITSAGEEAMLNPNGGAVALFTTTRAVYAQDNARLTESVFENIFEKIDGDYQRIGEIMKKGKNTGVDSLLANARKFTLIGDPTMRLNAPQHNILLDKINGSLISETPNDTLSALDEVTLSGHLENDNGQMLSSFSGKVFVSLFDKPINVKTLGNNDNSPVRSFELQNNVLFKGSATVTNGSFTIDFLIPKEINFNYGFGKISMYATDGLSQDAGGFYKEIVIGGSNETNITDEDGPEMDIYMNDESFVSGGITSLNPKLIVNLEDDYGINISSTSIGHDITAVIDDDESKTIKLNDWYESETDNYNSGKVVYPIGQLEPGIHKIRIKAWDLCNNSTEKELEFRVVDKDHTDLEHVLNYPNPFTTSTNFSFEHQFAGAMLDISISIFTLSGKLVKSITSTQLAEGFRTSDIHWDGNDDFGSNLAKGVYLYKVKVQDIDSELEMESDFKKLLILK